MSRVQQIPRVLDMIDTRKMQSTMARYALERRISHFTYRPQDRMRPWSVVDNRGNCLRMSDAEAFVFINDPGAGLGHD